MKAWISANRKLFFVLLSISSLIALTGVYFLGEYLLPGISRLYYENKNCSMVASIGDFYSALYNPNQAIAAMDSECEDYLAAQELQENGALQATYQSYENYLAKYPSGVLAAEAAQKAAENRYGFAQQELQQERYEAAASELTDLMQQYPSRPEFTSAKDLFVEVHVQWGRALLSGEDFGAAEQVFLTLKQWADNEGGTNHIRTANDELVGFYYDQAKKYQGEGEFDLAVEKFQQAIQVDEFSPIGVRAKDGFIEYLLAEGGKMLEAGEYEGAIEIYLLGLSEYPSESQDRLREQIIQSYADWALALAGEEQFTLALGKLAQMEDLYLLPGEQAEQIFADTRAEVYKGFSNSSGEEATQLMQQAVISICEGKAVDLLPIFGLDDSQVLFVMHGLKDEQLPNDMVAKTPGQLHYVVCGQLVQTILESKTVRMVPFRNNVQIRSLSRDETFNRVRYSWQVDVFHVPTGELAGQTQIWGTDPPLLSYLVNTTYLLYDYQTKTPLHGGSNHQIPTSTFGGAPSIFDLIYWLEKNILGQ